MRSAALLAILLAITPPRPVTVTVEDASGAPLKDELVILQDLTDREHEITRYLSDQNGHVPPFDLAPGLYRVIATAPYGSWETEVREFIVPQRPSGSGRPTDLVVKLKPMATHGQGDIVTLGTTRADILVELPNGRPAAGARILVRDTSATLSLERWSVTDENGRATIELVGNPTVVVVVYGDSIAAKEISPADRSPIIHLQGN